MPSVDHVPLDNFTLLDFYLKEDRVHLELAVPVWRSGLTIKLSADIERVQRVAKTLVNMTYTTSKHALSWASNPYLLEGKNYAKDLH